MSPQMGKPQHGITVVFLLVLVFFIMGLVGFLICHVLKKKGYRCRTFRDELDPDDKDENDDTVEKIVRCIIQNEANVEALKEMLGENEPDVPVPVPSLGHHSSSQDGGPPHHHTVHLGSTHAPCIHCSRRKRHPLQRQGRSKEGKSRMHPGETTVFSVGRYPKELWYISLSSSLALGTARDPGAAPAALGTLCQGLPTLPGKQLIPNIPSIPGSGKPFPVSYHVDFPTTLGRSLSREVSSGFVGEAGRAAGLPRPSSARITSHGHCQLPALRARGCPWRWCPAGRGSAQLLLTTNSFPGWCPAPSPPPCPLSVLFQPALSTQSAGQDARLSQRHLPSIPDFPL
uniref:RELT-like 2 n=1 Tax=Zonotrichia albicollis TaxID=44394 RepID=A0A8D2M763_ZONAL